MNTNLTAVVLLIGATACSSTALITDDRGSSTRSELGVDGGRSTEDLLDVGHDGPTVPSGWYPTAGSAPRATNHTLTLLDDGDALIVGGEDLEGQPLDAVWRYRAKTQSFSALRSLPSKRTMHSATRLDDGRVLVLGGTDGEHLLATGSIYDPAADSWSPTREMKTAVQQHAATLLHDNTVLVSGGWDVGGDVTSSLLVYNADKDTWLFPSASLAQARFSHSATLLANSKVAIAGGATNNGHAEPTFWSFHDVLEIYDPKSGKIESVGTLSRKRIGHTATVLPSGSLLIVGGWCVGDSCINDPQGDDDLFDPNVDKVIPIKHPIATRHNHTAATINGGLLIAGTNAADPNERGSTVIYSEAIGGSWRQAKPMLEGRWSAEAVTLRDGSVLVVGGKGAPKRMRSSCRTRPNVSCRRLANSSARPAQQLLLLAAQRLHDRSICGTEVLRPCLLPESCT